MKIKNVQSNHLTLNRNPYLSKRTIKNQTLISYAQNAIEALLTLKDMLRTSVKLAIKDKKYSPK